MVFVGDGKRPRGELAQPAVHRRRRDAGRPREAVPLPRRDGNYLVMVPALKTNSVGHELGERRAARVRRCRSTSSTSRSRDRHRRDDERRARAAGKHLLLTPGIYHLDEQPPGHARRHDRPGPRASRRSSPTTARRSLTVADVDGVTLAGLLLEAGPTSSPDAAPARRRPGARANHAANPTALFDVHCRVGGADVGTARELRHRQQQRRPHRQHLALARRPRRRRSAGP